MGDVLNLGLRAIGRQCHNEGLESGDINMLGKTMANISFHDLLKAPVGSIISKKGFIYFNSIFEGSWVGVLEWRKPHY